jgi:uncharacterized protein YoxC
MSIELSLAIIAIALVILIVFSIIIFLKIQKSVDGIEQDLHHLSVGTEDLVVKLNGLASDLAKKSQSLNFLFTPLGFLNKKIGTEASSAPKKVIPQLAEWITTSLVLFKKSKEFLKNISNENHQNGG